jgi:hypothetical protein
MGLILPASPVSPIFVSNDPYPDFATLYGLPYADLVPSAAGPIRFPWVRWSHGLLVEESTTNLVLNPAPASTTGYAGSVGTLALDSTFGLTRAKSLTLTATGIPASISYAYATTVAASFYSFSVWVYSTRAVTVYLTIDWKNSAGSAISTSSAVTSTTLYPGVWQRLTYENVQAPALAVRAHPTVQLTPPSVIGDKIWAANWQVEAKTHATSYAEGAMATGYTWAGTVDNSASVRATSACTYTLPVPLVPQNGFTVCCWVGETTGPTNSAQYREYLWANGGGVLTGLYSTGSSIYAGVAGSVTGIAATTIDWTLDGPFFIAATVKGTVVTIFIFQPTVANDTPLTSTAAITGAITPAISSVQVGAGPDGDLYSSNAAVEQAMVFSAALDVAELEILARASGPEQFADDPRIVFSAASNTDIVGTTAHALAATGTFQALGNFPGRIELTSALTAILTASQETYTYRLALPLGTGGFGVGSRVGIRGDTANLHVVGEKASSGTEDYLFFN